MAFAKVARRNSLVLSLALSTLITVAPQMMLAQDYPGGQAPGGYPGIPSGFTAGGPGGPPGPMGTGSQQMDPGMANAYRYWMQGQQLENAGDLHGAIEMFRKSAGLAGRPVKEVQHELAKLYARLGQNENATAAFRTALNIDYNYIECRNNYGAFLKRLGNEKDAENQFKQCIQIDPKFPIAYYNLGKLLHEKGDLDGAISNFETATNLKPDFAEAQEELGMAFYERTSRGDLSAAAEKLQRAAALLPQNPKIHYHLGEIYATKCNMDGAETEYRKALMCDSRFAAAHYELAKLRYYRGDLDRCISELLNAQKINPTYTSTQDYPSIDPVAVKTLEAHAYEHMGDLIHAYDAYEALVALKKSNALYAAKMKELSHEIKKAEADKRKKPLPYDPAEVDAFIAKGIDAYEDGDLTAARASFERALELNQQSFRARQNLSAVNEAQGNIDGAIKDAQIAMQLNPSYDGAVYNMAYLLEKANLPDDAARMYDTFRAKANSYPYNPAHINELQQDIIRQKVKEQYLRKRGF